MPCPDLGWPSDAGGKSRPRWGSSSPAVGGSISARGEEDLRGTGGEGQAGCDARVWGGDLAIRRPCVCGVDDL